MQYKVTFRVKVGGQPLEVVINVESETRDLALVKAALGYSLSRPGELDLMRAHFVEVVPV